MEGGVAIILLLVIGVIVLGGAAVFLTGGALGASKQGGEDDGHRPQHKRPTDPVQENVELAGVHHDDDEGRR